MTGPLPSARGAPAPAGATASATASASASATPSPARIVEVSTAAQLKSAPAAAAPGDTIRLADGTYRGNFSATTAGSAAARITLTGSVKSVLTASGGYGLHLDGASYWTVQGITGAGGQEGTVMDSTNGVVIDTVTVHDPAMEGVHFRTSNTDGMIRNSTIRDTGQGGRGWARASMRAARAARTTGATTFRS